MWKKITTFQSFLFVSICWRLVGSVRVCDYKTGQPLASNVENEEELAGAEYEGTEIRCGSDTHFCFAYWTESKTSDAGPDLIQQGCWQNSPKTACEQESCISTVYENPDLTSSNSGSSHRFCCCSTDNCNSNVTLIVLPPPIVSGGLLADEESKNEERVNKGPFLGIIFGATAGLFFIFIALLALTVAWRRSYYHRIAKNRAENVEVGERLMESCTGTQNQGEVGYEVVLGKEIGNGKFGIVYSGKMSGQELALKVFAAENREFFENEKFIYQKMGDTKDKNILKYHGWKEYASSTEKSTNLILVLDKINCGTLRDFLTVVPPNGLKKEVAFSIMIGITNGLSFLHGENKNNIVIAHRDLTSSNVLIDSYNNPYISDFGLSLLTSGSKYYFSGEEKIAELNSLAEAGTLRYMAPELLEGAVNLKDCENALKQVDVYALALILWELANVCSDIRLLSSNIIYTLPYEEEIGKDLSMETLARFVVTRRARPSFCQWLDCPLSAATRDTLNESWDAEPDARLTSLCILERLLDVSALKTSQNGPGTPLEVPSSAPWVGRNSCLERNLLPLSEERSSEYLLTSEKHRGFGFGSSSTEGESVVTTNTELSSGSALGPPSAAPIPFLQNIMN